MVPPMLGGIAAPVGVNDVLYNGRELDNSALYFSHPDPHLTEGRQHAGVMAGSAVMADPCQRLCRVQVFNFTL